MAVSLALFSGFKQIGHGTRGQLGEGFVARGEHGEGTSALERVNQARLCDGGNKGLEGASGKVCSVYDIVHRNSSRVNVEFLGGGPNLS